MADRPGFTHRPERHGVIGPFSGRQLIATFVSVVIAVVVLVAITTPLNGSGGWAGNGGPARDLVHHLVPAAGGVAGRGHRPGADGQARRRLDLPAGGPARQPDPARGPARQGGLDQLLDDLVPALPVGGPDPARPLRALPRPGPGAHRDQRPGDLTGRRPGVRRPLPAGLHDRLRRVRHDLPRVQGLRPADPDLHRPERRHRLDRRRAARRGRRHRPHRGDPAGRRVEHRPPTPDRGPIGPATRPRSGSGRGRERGARSGGPARARGRRSSPRRRPGRRARPCARPNRAGSRRTR